MRKRFQWILSASILLIVGIATRSTWADSAGPNCDELNREMNSIFIPDFNLPWPARSFACENTPTASTYRFTLALDGLYQVERQTRANGLGADYLGYRPDFYNYVRERIHQFQLPPKTPKGEGGNDDSATGTTGAPDAYATQLPSDAESIRPIFYSSKVSRDERSGWILHRAAHHDSQTPAHVQCNQGALKGLAGGNCDAELRDDHLFESGAYGYNLYYYLWARDRAGRDDLDREVLQSLVEQTVANRFNNVSNEQIRKYSNPTPTETL